MKLLVSLLLATIMLSSLYAGIEDQHVNITEFNPVSVDIQAVPAI